MEAFAAILVRALHLISMAAALGGSIYMRFILKPAAAALAPPDRAALGEAAAARMRPWAIAIALLLPATGLYNFFTKTAYPPGYHMWFGLKFLLAMHVLAVLVINTLPGREPARRARAATGAILSALAIVLISGWLRWISR